MLIGRKIKMTQVFSKEGEMIPCTVVRAGPCFVVQKKSLAKDGYNAYQLGFEETKKVNRPMSGHLLKSNSEPLNELPREIQFPEELAERIRYDAQRKLLIFRGAMTEEERDRLLSLSEDTAYREAIKKLFFASQKNPPLLRVLKEFRADESFQYNVGDRVTVEVLKEGDLVTVTGWTKGRGFAGGVKRWGWAGGPASHGSMSHRRIGSVGSGSSPGHPWKGRTLPGHYGVEKVTVKNLKVVKVEKDANLLFIKGALPGGRNGLLLIKKVEEKPQKGHKIK